MGKMHKPLTQELYNYLLSVSLRELPLQRELRQLTTHKIEHHSMMSTPDEAQFLGLLVKMIGAKRAIEVGVFTGYGTLAIAKALPDEGEIIACDIGEEWPAIGQPFWERMGVSHKIQLRIAPAQETLQQLLEDGQEGTFDFIFIDADKINYDTYYELSLQLLRPGGLIVLDNVLRIGENRVKDCINPATVSVNALNQKLLKDDRVNISLLSISQGIFLVHKNNPLSHPAT